MLRETERPLTVDDIIYQLGLSTQDRDLVYEDLKHIAKTIRRLSGGKETLVMQVPYCRDCGFIFKLDRPKKPSRCPRCKSYRIAPPAFKITTYE